MNDFIYQNVCGPWSSIKTHPIITEVYPEFSSSNWDNCYFALNVQQLHQVLIPTDQYKKIIISYHTEYFEQEVLWNFFNHHRDVEFLFLCDQTGDNIWPSNVTTAPWLTWGYQLDIAIQHFGIATNPNQPSKKISSLSHRPQLHKAAITAFLLEKFTSDDLILSWHNNVVKDLYYKADDYFIPDTIKKYLEGKFNNLQPIKLDLFENEPINNVNWHHPAYLDAAVNFTNESIFNSNTVLNDQLVNLPTPYLTEKTWKPLLSGRAFVPVGQVNTLQALTEVGFVFDYGMDLSFDQCSADFDRLIKIYELTESLLNLSAMEIYKKTCHSNNYNLEHIRSGNLKTTCNLKNTQTFEETISKW